MRYILAVFGVGLLLFVSACSRPITEKLPTCGLTYGEICPGETPTNSHVEIEQMLQNMGWTRKSNEGAIPSVWARKGGDWTVSVSDDFHDPQSTHVKIRFPEGTLQCEAGVTAAGIAPLERLRQLDKAGYDAAKSGTITVDGQEISTGCKPV